MDVLSLQLRLFCLILAGAAAEKLGLIGQAGRKTLSDLLLGVILPCNILSSYISLSEVPEAFVGNCIRIFLISAGIQAAAILGSRILFRRFPERQRGVLSYGLICSNAGFIGLPVVETLFGSLGVMYTSIFMIPFRFSMWTVGLAQFIRVDRRETVGKLLKNPCILATFGGLFIALGGLPVPGFLSGAVASLSGCTVPASMLVIGSILAGVPMRALLSKPVLFFTVVRLILFPGAVFLVLRPLHIDALLCGICLLMTGMPAGGTASILADKYGGDASLASRIIFTSTLASTVTVPLWMMAAAGMG